MAEEDRRQPEASARPEFDGLAAHRALWPLAASLIRDEGIVETTISEPVPAPRENRVRLVGLEGGMLRSARDGEVLIEADSAWNGELGVLILELPVVVEVLEDFMEVVRLDDSRIGLCAGVSRSWLLCLRHYGQ